MPGSEELHLYGPFGEGQKLRHGEGLPAEKMSESDDLALSRRQSLDQGVQVDVSQAQRADLNPFHGFADADCWQRAPGIPTTLRAAGQVVVRVARAGIVRLVETVAEQVTKVSVLLGR